MSDIFRSEYRELNDGEKTLMANIKAAANRLNEYFDEANVPTIGREISLAKTKLEESVMWAVKGVTK